MSTQTLRHTHRVSEKGEERKRFTNSIKFQSNVCWICLITNWHKCIHRFNVIWINMYIKWFAHHMSKRKKSLVVKKNKNSIKWMCEWGELDKNWIRANSVCFVWILIAMEENQYGSWKRTNEMHKNCKKWKKI